MPCCESPSPCLLDSPSPIASKPMPAASQPPFPHSHVHSPSHSLVSPPSLFGSFLFPLPLPASLLPQATHHHGIKTSRRRHRVLGHRRIRVALLLRIASTSLPGRGVMACGRTNPEANHRPQTIDAAVVTVHSTPQQPFKLHGERWCLWCAPSHKCSKTANLAPHHQPSWTTIPDPNSPPSLAICLYQTRPRSTACLLHLRNGLQQCVCRQPSASFGCPSRHARNAGGLLETQPSPVNPSTPAEATSAAALSSPTPPPN